MRSVVHTTRDEFDPAVSPATGQFAFVTNRTGYPEIWVQNKDSSRPLVTPADFDGVASMAVGSLAFSRDGTRLAFQLAAAAETSSAPTVPGGFRIWVKAVAGGKPFPIGGAETYQDAPTWSPDNDWIAYLTSSGGGYSSIVKSQVGTRGNAVVLWKNGVPPLVARPQWSPDGKWILCETTEGLSLIAADGSLRSKVIADTRMVHLRLGHGRATCLRPGPERGSAPNLVCFRGRGDESHSGDQSQCGLRPASAAAHTRFQQVPIGIPDVHCSRPVRHLSH